MKRHYYLKGILLCLCLFIGTKTFAYDAEIDGIYYNLSGDEATVTYQKFQDSSPYYISDYSGDIVIPESVTYNNKTYTVTSIGSGAFWGCYGLTAITIPNSVTSIGYDAFCSCSSLTVVHITDLTAWCNISLGRADANPLNYAHHLYLHGQEIKDLVIPEGVTTIGDYAFYSCSGLNSVTIPESVNSIGEWAFFGCDGLTSVTIPESVTIIGGAAFRDCTGLTSITIPNSVTSIGSGAFMSCNGLTSVTIPESVTQIGYNAFGECSLTSIKVVEGNTTYDSRNDCNAIIETATNTLIAGCQNTTISNSVTSFGYYAFCGCRGLSSIVIPNSVNSIGNYTFSGCSDLTSVTIPNSVTSIGNGVFSGCSGLTSVTIPSSVTSIGDQAFMYSGLTSVTIPSSVTSIGDQAFMYSGLTSLTIPEGVTSIGDQAFKECRSLTSVTIPNSMTNIGDYAFYSCRRLTSVTIPSSIACIGERAFSWCTSLTSVIVDRATPLTLTTDIFYNEWNATLYVPYGSKSAYEAADYWKDFNEIVEFNPINVGGTGFATYCSECDLDFSEVSGLKAYIASGFSPSTGKLVLTRVTEVPAGEGLYIVGDEGRYNIPATTTDMLYSNLLKGVTTATTIYPTDGDYTNFILANGSHGVAFYSLSEAGELAAGKAYLQLPTASVSEVKAISVIFDDDDATSIASPLGETGEGAAIYNLQGQQVNAPNSGLYIINGKKVLIK